MLLLRGMVLEVLEALGDVLLGLVDLPKMKLKPGYASQHQDIADIVNVVVGLIYPLGLLFVD